MKLYINDKAIAILFGNKKEETLVKDRFTYNDMSKVFQGGSFDKTKIEKKCFIKKHKEYGLLPSGFLKELLEFIKKEDIKPEYVKDNRTKYSHQNIDYTNEYLASYFPFNYNEHQVEALKKLLKVNCGIIKIPTAGGKSFILNSFVKETRLPMLVVVSKIDLANQLYKGMADSGVDNVGIWHSKKKIDGDVVFATIGSVGSLPSLNKFEVLAIDEVHNSSSKQYQDFLKKTNYPIRIGFSATPNKGDPYNYALVRQNIGDVIFEAKADPLIENEVIALPKITFVPVKCPKSEDWASAYLAGIIENHDRNKAISQIIEKYNKKSLILIKDVKHGQGERIKQYIEEDTHKKVEFVHGSTENRDEILEEFENGDIDVLISTNILNEGISIKTIELLINASGGKSKRENLQKIGRGTRTTDSKKEVMIFDFYDYGNKFTERHSQDREQHYRNEGFREIEHKSLKEVVG